MERIIKSLLLLTLSSFPIMGIVPLHYTKIDVNLDNNSVEYFIDVPFLKMITIQNIIYVPGSYSKFGVNINNRYLTTEGYYLYLYKDILEKLSVPIINCLNIYINTELKILNTNPYIVSIKFPKWEVDYNNQFSSLLKEEGNKNCLHLPKEVNIVNIKSKYLTDKDCKVEYKGRSIFVTCKINRNFIKHNDAYFLYRLLFI